MTVIAIPEQPESHEDDGAALAAGEATAHVEHLAEDVAEAVEVAEFAQVTAEVATELSAEAVTTSQLLVRQNEDILSGIDAIRQGLVVQAEMFDAALAKLEEMNEPPPEPVKKDTAPKRRSDAHRLLYG